MLLEAGWLGSVPTRAGPPAETVYGVCPAREPMLTCPAPQATAVATVAVAGAFVGLAVGLWAGRRVRSAPPCRGGGEVV